MKLRVTVNGVAYEVEVEILEDRELTSSPAPAPRPAPPVTSSMTPPRAPAQVSPQPARAGAKALTCPIPGTVMKVLVQPGQRVKANEPAFVIDAMKMNTQVPSPSDGVVKEVLVKSGDALKMGQILLTFE